MLPQQPNTNIPQQAPEADPWAPQTGEQVSAGRLLDRRRRRQTERLNELVHGEAFYRNLGAVSVAPAAEIMQAHGQEVPERTFAGNIPASSMIQRHRERKATQDSAVIEQSLKSRRAIRQRSNQARAEIIKKTNKARDKSTGLSKKEYMVPVTALDASAAYNATKQRNKTDYEAGRISAAQYKHFMDEAREDKKLRIKRTSYDQRQPNSSQLPESSELRANTRLILNKAGDIKRLTTTGRIPRMRQRRTERLANKIAMNDRRLSGRVASQRREAAEREYARLRSETGTRLRRTMASHPGHTLITP